MRDAERVFTPAPREGDGAEVASRDSRAAQQAEPRSAAHIVARQGESAAKEQAPATAQAGHQSSEAAPSSPGAVQAARFEEQRRENHQDRGDRGRSAGQEAQRVEASASARTGEGAPAQSNQTNAAAHDPRPVGEARASAPAPGAQGGQGAYGQSASAQGEQAAIASANRGLEVALKQQGGSVRLKMSPESLGSLKVEMTIAKGVVSATLRASTAEARELLTRNIDTLRSALEAKGLSVDRLSITLAPASHGGSSGHSSTTNGQAQQHSANSGSASQHQNGDHDAGGERSKGFFERHERNMARRDDAPARDETEERLFQYRFGLHAIG